MSNKNVIAVFVIGLALLLGAFWAGLYAVRKDEAAGRAPAAEPPPVQAAPTQAPPTEPQHPDTRYIVQVSAYGTAEKANELVSQLKKQKYLAAYTQTPTEVDPLYRVCIGTFKVREDAQQVASELSSQGFKGVMILPLKKN
jgi:cell division septation protein DedD